MVWAAHLSTQMWASLLDCEGFFTQSSRRLIASILVCAFVSKSPNVGIQISVWMLMITAAKTMTVPKFDA
jgi:hypothetical protein